MQKKWVVLIDAVFWHYPQVRLGENSAACANLWSQVHKHETFVFGLRYGVTTFANRYSLSSYLKHRIFPIGRNGYAITGELSNGLKSFLVKRSSVMAWNPSIVLADGQLRSFGMFSISGCNNGATKLYRMHIGIEIGWMKEYSVANLCEWWFRK
jgi:hypothetical protein